MATRRSPHYHSTDDVTSAGDEMIFLTFIATYIGRASAYLCQKIKEHSLTLLRQEETRAVSSACGKILIDASNQLDTDRWTALVNTVVFQP